MPQKHPMDKEKDKLWKFTSSFQFEVCSIKVPVPVLYAYGTLRWAGPSDTRAVRFPMAHAPVKAAGGGGQGRGVRCVRVYKVTTPIYKQPSEDF